MPTPYELGYRMPAEWEPHAATWLAWPHNRDDWPGKFGPISWVYTEIVRHLSRAEPVNILVNNGRAREKAAEKLVRSGVDLTRVTFVEARTDRVWVRDTGPSFVVKDGATEDRVGIVDWRFNAWAKYENYRHDNRIPRRIAKQLGLRRWQPTANVQGKDIRIVLEGG